MFVSNQSDKRMLYKTLLILHIIAGFTALLTGLIAMITAKGKKLHLRSGKIYYFAMLGIGLTSFPMTILKPNPFLWMIAGFSTYMTLSGYAYLKYPKGQEIPRKSLWSPILGLIILVTGLILFLEQAHSQMLPVAITFALIFGSMLFTDSKRILKKMPLDYTIIMHTHIGRMVGSYIATLTAFLLINIQTDPAWIIWLGPTAVLTPVIIYFQKRYTKKKTRANQLT